MAETSQRVYRLLKEMTVSEWALWEWIEVTATSNEEAVYVRGKERTPDRAVAEARNFHQWLLTRRAYEQQTSEASKA
jgi:hypothetical protein